MREKHWVHGPYHAVHTGWDVSEVRDAKDRLVAVVHAATGIIEDSDGERETKESTALLLTGAPEMFHSLMELWLLCSTTKVIEVEPKLVDAANRAQAALRKVWLGE